MIYDEIINTLPQLSSEQLINIIKTITKQVKEGGDYHKLDAETIIATKQIEKEFKDVGLTTSLLKRRSRRQAVCQYSNASGSITLDHTINGPKRTRYELRIDHQVAGISTKINPLAEIVQNINKYNTFLKDTLSLNPEFENIKTIRDLIVEFNYKNTKLLAKICFVKNEILINIFVETKEHIDNVFLNKDCKIAIKQNCPIHYAALHPNRVVNFDLADPESEPIILIDSRAFSQTKPTIVRINRYNLFAINLKENKMYLLDYSGPKAIRFVTFEDVKESNISLSDALILDIDKKDVKKLINKVNRNHK